VVGGRSVLRSDSVRRGAARIGGYPPPELPSGPARSLIRAGRGAVVGSRPHRAQQSWSSRPPRRVAIAVGSRPEPAGGRRPGTTRRPGPPTTGPHSPAQNLWAKGHTRSQAQPDRMSEFIRFHSSSFTMATCARVCGEILRAQNFMRNFFSLLPKRLRQGAPTKSAHRV
jgi:hypothetical protein